MGDVGKKYVPMGVFLKCDKGAGIGKLSILRTSPQVYGETWANEFDAVPMVNIPPLGACAVTNGPCAPATTIWSKPAAGSTSVVSGRPLVEDSFCTCAVGGKIDIFFSMQGASDAMAAAEAKKQAAQHKSNSMWLLGAAIVVGVVATVATGGLAGPAAAALISAAVTGAAVGAAVGAVAGGVEGYAHSNGSLTGTLAGAGKGLLFGAAIGAAAPLIAASAPASALAVASMATFGAGVVCDAEAFYFQPTLENGLVLVADAVIIFGPKLGEKALPAKEPIENVPENDIPAEKMSGKRPSQPEYPVLDANGKLTAYGKWYYQRPSGYRKGVKDSAWDKNKSDDGKVYDPLTKKEINPDEKWDMGHKPGYEFRKHRQSAAERGIGRDQFLDEYNESDHYRPELPDSNRSHAGEDQTDSYLGD